VKSFILRFFQSGSDWMQLDQLKRRDFITLLGGTAAAWPFGAPAQQFAGVKRLGVLMSVRENDPEGKAQLSAFTEALAALGWIVDRNLWMDIRWGGGDVSRTRTFAKELVALQPDVILTQGTPGTAALQPETRTIPIFVVVADPICPGFVSSLSRPGGNITGFINSEASLGAKMLELLTEIAPTLKRVAMIFNSDMAPGHGTYYFRDFEAAARSSKLEPIAADARSDAKIETVVTSLEESPAAASSSHQTILCSIIASKSYRVAVDSARPDWTLPAISELASAAIVLFFRSMFSV
jgi:putative tryptophan/tyrosine transport system substrate-binding protein